jgi:hypothetical protein
MTDKTIFKFSVYDDKTTQKVYWDADIKIERGEDWLKVMRMLFACQQEVMDIIIKNMGIHIDNEYLHRRKEKK